MPHCYVHLLHSLDKHVHEVVHKPLKRAKARSRGDKPRSRGTKGVPQAARARGAGSPRARSRGIRVASPSIASTASQETDPGHEDAAAAPSEADFDWASYLLEGMPEAEKREALAILGPLRNTQRNMMVPPAAFVHSGVCCVVDVGGWGRGHAPRRHVGGGRGNVLGALLGTAQTKSSVGDADSGAAAHRTEVSGSQLVLFTRWQ